MITSTSSAAGNTGSPKQRDGVLAGFLAAQLVGDALHIAELAVSLDHQQQGLGRALMAAADARAGDLGLAALTLTTFTDVPWNAPFYEKLGFEKLTADSLDDRLADILARRNRAGLAETLRDAQTPPR